MSLLETVTGFQGVELNLAVVAVLLSTCAFMIWATPRMGFMKKAGPYVWVIVAAILLTNFNILPKKNPMYSQIFKYGVPISIVLFLLEIDLKQIKEILSWRLIALWCVTTLGSFFGGIVACALFANDPNMIKAIAGKAAAWIGGVPNFIAVSVGMFKIDPDYYSSAAAVGIVPYLVWIAVLFSLSGSKLESILNDKWIKPKHKTHEHIANMDIENKKEQVMTHRHALTLFAIAFVLYVLAKGVDIWTGGLSFTIPGFQPIEFPWMLTLTTFAIIVAAVFKTSRIPGSNYLSLTLLYISLASYLAKSDILVASKLAPVILPPFIVIILVHIGAVFIGCRLFRVDVASTAIVSVSNVGGSVTAPLIAVAYKLPEMIPVAVVLASLGTIFGNYFGWMIGALFLN